MAFDTDPVAEALHQDVIRRMTPEARLRLALEMSESMRNLALASLRSRHPELSETESIRELQRIMYGAATP